MSVSRACLGGDVLAPRFLRACLLELGDSNAQLYEPVWSAGILAELTRKLTASGQSEAICTQIVDELRTGWPDSEVVPEQALMASLMANSLHAVAADTLATAIAGAADTLVTTRPGDFPSSLCAPHHVVSRSAEHFLRELFFPDRDRVVLLLTRLVAGIRRPTPISFRDFLGGLRSGGVALFVDDLVNYRRIVDLERLTDDQR